jgi:hypothetical protein
MNTFRVAFAFKVKVEAENGEEAEKIARKKIGLMLPEDLAKSVSCVEVREHYEVGLTRDEFDAQMKGLFEEGEPDPNDLQSADDFNPDIAEGSL